MRLPASSLLSNNQQFASSVPAAVVVPSIRRCLFSTSTVAMGHGSHSSDNRPHVLEQEKQKNLRGVCCVVCVERGETAHAHPSPPPSLSHAVSAMCCLMKTTHRRGGRSCARSTRLEPRAGQRLGGSGELVAVVGCSVAVADDSTDLAKRHMLLCMASGGVEAHPHTYSAGCTIAPSHQCNTPAPSMHAHFQHSLTGAC